MMGVRWPAGSLVLSLVGVALCLQGAMAQCSMGVGEILIAPNFTEALLGSYSLTVEMTSNKDSATVYVTEVHERGIYHDARVDVVGVTIEVNGTSVAYQYYPDSDVLVEEVNGECHQMPEQPNFAWGWWDKDSAHGGNSFGPSSILRLSTYLTTERLEETFEDEGLKVNIYKACASENTVELRYHYAKPPWIMPEYTEFSGQEGQLPVKMEVEFMDGTNRMEYTFVDFVPYIRSHSSLEPPRGMACEAITGIQTGAPVPSIPNHFSLAEEGLLNSLIDGMDFGYQYMDKVQMTYAGEISLVSVIATMPYDNAAHTSFAIRVIHDFNTGVQYTIYKEYGNCSRDFIPPFTFDSHFGGFLGTGDTLLSPNDMFHLDDKFAFVGERESRDISGDLWTSTRIDDIPDPITGGIQNFEKAVLEYYFSQGAERTPSGDLTFTNLPFRGDVFIYNKSDPTQVVTTVTTNFYDFRVVELFSPEEFSVEECFERYDDDWSYLDIIFPAKKDNQLAAAAAEQTRFQHEVMLKLIDIGRLSPVRIASIDVEAGISGILPNTTDADIVIAKVKLLERAPYIYSYRQPPDEENPKPGTQDKTMANLRRAEDCATICSLNPDLNCKSFHHCTNYNCYFSTHDSPDGEPMEDFEYPCEHWVFDLNNQTVEDYPSEMVYRQVFEAVKMGEFIISVPYQNTTVLYEASMSLHYRTPDPMDPIRAQFTLEARLMTVEDPDDTIPVADLTECMVLCVGWVRYRCETLIHQTDEGLCLLLSRHYHDLNHTELVPHTHSYVHGRSYLVDFDPILGGVALNSTGPVYSPVEHLEYCARLCNDEKTISCQSFEYCPSNQMCHLHAEHFLDVVDGGDYDTGTACIHFSRKTDSSFTRYEDQGLTPSQHKLEAHFTSPEACAKLCIDDTDEVCQSYDFCNACDDNTVAVCGEENRGNVGLCFLAPHHLGESGLTLTKAPGCDHYDRTTFGDQDYASWIASQRKEDLPYTPGAMAGLAFGMIFLGILLSVGFLVAITQLRPSSMPKDFELSFTKLKASGESTI